jgi:hypothetical protein
LAFPVRAVATVFLKLTWSELMQNGILACNKLTSVPVAEFNTHTHTHTHIYIYIYLCVCVCVCALYLHCIVVSWLLPLYSGRPVVYCCVVTLINSLNKFEIYIYIYIYLLKCINLLKPTGYVMQQQFNVQHLYFLPTLYLWVFLFIWEQTATCATYNTKALAFITELKSVYSAVRTGLLNKAVCASSLKG